MEVIDVDELDEGNISAAAENKTNNGRLSWTVPHWDLTATDTYKATDSMNIEPIIEPNNKQNIKTNIEPKIEPNIDRNIELNIELNIEPNIEPNIELNI